jgi:2-haloacid dehalogenase
VPADILDELKARAMPGELDKVADQAAGWNAALIKRAGNDVLGVGPQPQIVGNDLNDVADQLIARHAR